MKKLFLFAALATFSTAIFAQQAPATEKKEDVKDLRHDMRDVKKDKRERREEIKAGDKDAAKATTNEIKADKKDMRKDVREARKDGVKHPVRRAVHPKMKH